LGLVVSGLDLVRSNSGALPVAPKAFA